MKSNTKWLINYFKETVDFITGKKAWICFLTHSTQNLHRSNVKPVYLIAIVGPATELHVTVLVIEGEPRDVYLACALENARGHVQATAVVSDHHVGLVCPVKTLVSTKKVHILSVDIDQKQMNGKIELGIFELRL